MTLVTLILATAQPASADARQKINFNFDWEFQGQGDTMWRHVNLPHDFLIEQPWVAPDSTERPDYDNPMANIASRLSARAFKEPTKSIYRKVFRAPDDWRNRRVLLDFEGIMLRGEAMLNGKHIGKTDYGYLGFESDITDLLDFDNENTLTVIADCGEPENSRWYTGGGLYRNVNVVLTDTEQFLTRHPLKITTNRTDSDSWQVAVESEVEFRDKSDSAYLRLRILDPKQNTVYDSARSYWRNRRQPVRAFTDTALISNPMLWDTNSPSLYSAIVELTDARGNIIDSYTEKFGIREIEYSPDFGLKLNGKKTLLKGIANHHTLGALGAAAYPRAIEKRLKLLKDFGFNHVRTSHNPYSVEFMEICDSLGLLVVDELYDKWTRQHCGGAAPWTERWQHDVPEWTRRDRNHPSVVMWSLGNELQLIGDLPFNDWGVTPYILQRDLLRRYDHTRPVTVAMHPRGRNELTDSLPAPLATVTDIAAYNYRYMYFPGDAKRFPDMIFYQSEANLSNMGPNYFDMDLDKVAGMAYWGMIDYLGESNGWPAKGWANGVFDITLRPKPMAYFLRSYFKEDEPLVYIAPYIKSKTTEWNGVTMGGLQFYDGWLMNPGQSCDIYTFTNADEVELIVNGKSLGRKANDSTDSKKRNRINWENVSYAPGKIEARAYTDGKLVASHRLDTPQPATKLTARADNLTPAADGADLVTIDIEAVDSKGRRDPRADQPVTFTITGPAEIVAVSNGDITSNESYTPSPLSGSSSSANYSNASRSLYHGAATVTLRIGRAPGKITLTATTPGLRPASITLQSHP